MIRTLYVFGISCLAMTLSAQADSAACACCTPFHQQFDFWLGDWTVIDTAGKYQGKNSIKKLENGCVLQENWTGAGTGTGTSYNYFDANDSTWNQVWIDNQGKALVLKGELIEGVMLMKSVLQPGEKVEQYYNQVSWTPNADGTVTQRWDVLNTDGIILSTLFLGIYTRR